MRVVTKPWGYEKWIRQTDYYVLKEIFMKAGYRSSLQYHVKKEETNYILNGRGLLRYTLDRNIAFSQRVLLPGDVFHILPNIVHRVEAVTDLTMIEASTPEVDDIIRLADDWNRGDGRIESEHQ